jgi:CRP/FNR family transcriptional regulator/CRP/FNR family cyclic AMP-dependent transcriptional regulator
MNINDLIPTIPIFATLEQDEIEVLKKRLEKIVCQEGMIVCREGDPGDGLFVIAIGAIRIVKKIDDKNEKVLAGILEKGFFGELSLLDGQPRSATAVVARPGVLLKITNTNFNLLMHEAPFTALKIVSQIACHLSTRLRDSNLKLAELENYRLLRG